MMNKTTKTILWVVFLVILAVYPKVFGVYYTNLFVTFAVFAVFAVSLNVLLGYTGLLSFGHAMFFGAGGYGTALALKHIEGIGLMSAIGIGFLSTVILAVVLCPLVVRVSGTAFAMLHLAFGQLLYVLALKLRNITGGEDGIGNFPIPDLFGIPMKGAPENFYYLAVVLLGVSVWLMWFFTKTPFGQIQVGIRDNAKRIDYLGYKVPGIEGVDICHIGCFCGDSGLGLRFVPQFGIGGRFFGRPGVVYADYGGDDRRHGEFFRSHLGYGDIPDYRGVGHPVYGSRGVGDGRDSDPRDHVCTAWTGGIYSDNEDEMAGLIRCKG